MFVRVSDTLVMLVLVLVVDGVRRGIPAKPELFDELLTFFVRLESLECRPLFAGDDVGDVLVEPSAQGACSRFPGRGTSWPLPWLVIGFGVLSCHVDL